MDLSPRPNYKLPDSSPLALKHDAGVLKPFEPVKRPLWIYPFTFFIGAIFTWVLVNLALMMDYPVLYGFGASALMIGLLGSWVHGNFISSIVDFFFDLPDLIAMLAAQRWREFIMTMGLFTRLPLPAFDFDDKLDVTFVKKRNPAWAYPLAGFIIGLITALVIVLCAFISIPTALSAILAVLVSVILTGSLHEDGLSDFLDGVGGATREDRLRIMKDSRLGSYGGIAMIFSLAARVTAIAILPTLAAAAAVIAAHTIARSALVLPLHWYPPAKRDGTAVAATGWVSGETTAFVLVTSILLTLMVQPVPATAFIAWLAGTIAVLLTARYAYRKLGGYTGDVLGACEQFGEIAVLWSIAAFLVK